MTENSKLKDLVIDLKDAVNRLDYEILIEQNVKSVRAQNLLQEIICAVWSIRVEINNP